MGANGMAGVKIVEVEEWPKRNLKH
jgi:hypothetical protein